MKGVSSIDTFSIIPFFGNCGRHLFKIRNFPLCMEIMEMCLLKRYFQYKSNFFKNYERCPNIIPFFWELWKVSLQHKFKIFHYLYGNCGKCLLKRHFQYKSNFLKIVEGVSSRNTFSINPIFWNYKMCLLKRHFQLKFIFLKIFIMILKIVDDKNCRRSINIFPTTIF